MDNVESDVNETKESKKGSSTLIIEDPKSGEDKGDKTDVKNTGQISVTDSKDNNETNGTNRKDEIVLGNDFDCQVEKDPTISETALMNNETKSSKEGETSQDTELSKEKDSDTCENVNEKCENVNEKCENVNEECENVNEECENENEEYENANEECENDNEERETINGEDENEAAKLVEAIITSNLIDDASPKGKDQIEIEEVENEGDIYSMRKESLKNTIWTNDSEDDSEDEDPDLDIPQNKILWAAEKNEIEALRQLLENDPSLVYAKDEDGYTALHRAAYNNHVEVMKLLLTFNADMTAKTEDQWEPLHCACKWDSVETASLLIQNGADVNATTKGGLTPLHLAASNAGGRRTLELLLWHPYVDPTIKSERGDTAYDTACQNSPHYKLFEMIDISINCY